MHDKEEGDNHFIENQQMYVYHAPIPTTFLDKGIEERKEFA